jgi:heptosyltransferase II
MKPLPKSAIVRKPHARILVRATNWIGDTVMTTPAIQRLREHEPNAHISLLCHAKLRDLWRHNPHLNEVIPYDPEPLIPELRKAAFDVAIIFPNSFRSAWECWRAQIPCRIGFAGHMRRKLLTDVVVEAQSEQPVTKQVTVAGKTFTIKSYPTIRHQSRRYLDLISYLGGKCEFVPPKIWLAHGDMPALTKFLHEGTRPFFGLNAGAEYGPAKRWLPDRFVEVAKRVSAEIPCRWLLFGGPNDVATAREIETGLRAHFNDDRMVVNVAGQTTLLELCELIKFCRLFITNDTGPMHLADALGTPLVAIFGSTSAELTGPVGPRSRVVHEPVECSPCFLRECPIDFRCMQGITVESVVKAVLDLWQTIETGPHRS